jgi:hypothetical protein
MQPATSDPQMTHDGGERRGEDDDQRPEPHGEEDPAPEEAGYGYGV